MHLYIINFLTLVNYAITNYEKRYVDDTKARQYYLSYEDSRLTLSSPMRFISDGTHCVMPKSCKFFLQYSA